MEHVTIFSRAGRKSLTHEHLATLEAGSGARFVQTDRAPRRPEALSLLQHTTVLASTNRCLPTLDEHLLRSCPRLRAVVLYATGHDHVDVDLLARYDVTLSTLPEYATEAVAEHAIALLFALATRLHLAHDRSRGLLPESTSLRGVELGGRVFGVIGTGRIGLRAAELASALSMEVLGSDIDPTARRKARDLGITVVDTPTLIRHAHAVAICASTVPGSDPILDRTLIRQLTPGAFVVNVARPGRVDTAAIVEAIRAGRVRGYGVDDEVLDPDVDGDLLTEGRVLQTGHSAWWRDESLQRGSEMFGAAILDAVAGHPRDVVTPRFDHDERSVG